MKVALVCPYDWTAPGGVQVHVAQLAEHLLERGHDVRVLAPSRRRPGQPWVCAVGRGIAVPYNGSVAPIDARPWHVRLVRRELAAFAPDLVHVHEPFAPSTSMWATLAAGVPVVATFHAGADRALLYDLAAPLLRLLAARIRVRIAVSERSAAFARARIGGAFRVVPNGIDVGRFAEAGRVHLEQGGGPPQPTVAFVGRLERRKGFPVAVEAFQTIASQRPDVRLVVAGEGTERTVAERLPQPLRDRVRLLGRVSNADLTAYLGAADVLLAPSLRGESFGIVLVEAMAAGVPVVASRIAGYDEVLRDGVEGLLVPPGDPGALAAAALGILGDRELAAGMSEAGRARAASYDWSVVGPKVEEAYRDAIASGGAPVR